MEDIGSRFDQIIPVVSNLEVRLPQKLLAINNIGDSIKFPQRQLWKGVLSMKYDNNNNINPKLAPLPIKWLHKGTKVMSSLIEPGIKQGDCSNA